MSKLNNLLETMEKHVKRQDELLKIRSGVDGKEGRDLTEDESTEFDMIEEEVRKLKEQIEKEEKFAKVQKRNAAMHFMNVEQENKEEKKIKKSYSLLRSIKLASKGKALDGVEREMQQEAEREAKTRGETIQGIGLPSFMMEVPNKRALVVGTAATAGNLVATDLGEFTPALRPRLKVIEAGAQVMSGLTGNLDLPIGDALASATWEGEIDAAAETTPSTTKLSLTPNRLAAFTNLSNQLMIQSSPSVENWVRTELSSAIARTVDLAAINGSGTGSEPAGLLQTAGIGDVAGGTNGAVPTYANIVDLETQIAVDNADVENMGYIVTPGVRGVLKSTAQTANNAGYIWSQGNMLNGYSAYVSTQVPSDLDKGTSTGVCHAILFGNWADLIIANWGLVDIIVDPYTLAKNGETQIVINSYWDIGIKHAESFAAMKDALLS